MPTLQWLTRDDDIRASSAVPYRLLEEVPDLGHGDRDAGNMLIQGDNLDALKALLPFYAGQVKCIYIDPPYNTRSAFEHYDDNLEHTKWLAMMWPRLELLRDLLSEEGSIWVSIDDNEAHYLKVIMDEIFGRKNYIANVVWQKKYAPANDTLWLSESHDHLHCYARDKSIWRPNQLPRSEESKSVYKNPDNDPRGLWRADNYSFVDEQDRLALDTPVEGWDEINLSVWLDRQVRQIYVPPSELLKWLRDTIAYLTKIRGISMPALWRAKYPLALKIEAKIKAIREAGRINAYQLYLFAPEAKSSISFDDGFQFSKDMYFDVRKHRSGAFKFRKHFLGADNVPAFSGKEGDGGEEFQCAQMLDSLNEVEFWIRNVSQHDNSFRLPLATRNFYPDFVAKLKDGRIFVVEYKGDLLSGHDDTNEKRLVGEVWERASGGKGLFAMIEKDVAGRNMREQLTEKLKQSPLAH